MITPRNALLLVGSAKKSESTSASLGSYLAERLQQYRLTVQTVHLHQVFRTATRTAALLEAVDRADLVILAFPLYVDTLPYLVTSALEQMAEHRRGLGETAQQLVAIANCGFPEAHHNDMALAICRRFAQEARFEWAGGLALGMGGAINGQPLAEAGGPARNAIAALDQAAEALATGHCVPEQAIKLMARPSIPHWLYLLFSNWGWRRQARRYGVHNRLKARPYQP